MKNTILSIFLKALNLKFTRHYADKLYADHPYRGSLYGLSQMLSSYNIPNSGIRSFDKDLEQLNFPFIAYINEDFYVVTRKSTELLSLRSQNKAEVQTIDNFKEKWSGIALVGYPDKKFEESDYWLHLFQSFFYLLRNYILLILCIISTIEEKSKERINHIMEIRGLKSIKYESDTFVSLLSKQDYYEIANCQSRIIFGNPSAKLKITILTNSHCGPCATLHKQIDEMLEKAGDKFCLQYVFLAFNSVVVISNRFLIAAYFKYGAKGVNRIYSDWFEKGKYSYEKYIRKYSLELNTPDIDNEILSHDIWKEHHQLTATPTVLVNGYKLPAQYSISDLIYFA